MKIAYGKPQSDAWLHARCGRLCGSRIADAASYLTRASGSKKAGDSSAKRDRYKLELIAERLTGNLADHYVSPSMEWGVEQEQETIQYYESVLRVMVLPVGYVIHPDYPFWGSTPDGLVGSDGILEVKNPDTVTHLTYFLDGILPEQYVPQVVSQLACTGKERRFADFVSRDSRIQDERLRFFYKRIGRDELEWEVGALKLTGENVIDYFTSEVIRLNAEIEQFFQEHGAKPIAPFPVEIISEDGEILEEKKRYVVGGVEYESYEAWLNDSVAP